MSESNPNPSERSPKDPVRVVYHAANRTFARLFNERSLEEVKDVVRRKLGLGSQTYVSLKQMGHDELLDLEDDDDFQAFRVLLRSSVSVDIQVTVGRPQGSPVPAPVARVSPNLGDVLKQRSSQQPGERPSASKPSKITLASPSKEPAGVAVPSVQPEVARTAAVSTTPAKIPELSKRKRKVSFDDADAVASDKPTEQHAPAKPTAISPVASAKTAESSTASKPVGLEEPPKKKQKKESTKTKTKATDTQTTECPAMKAPAPKPKPKKSTTLDPGSKAETSAPKIAETSEPPAMKQKKQKKYDSIRPKKSSASGDQDDADRPSSPRKEASLQPAEKPTGSGVEGDTSTIRKSGKTKPAKGTVCASIPQTSASTSVRSEVAAAILSGYLSKASKTIPPEPPAERKSVKRYTEKSSASSSALPVEPATVLDAPANKILDIVTEHRLGQVALTIEPPPETPDLNGPPCPICLEAPFHIRYYCPIVLKGPDSIRERLDELKSMNTDDQQSLIKQLEGLLRDPRVTSKFSLYAASTGGMQSSNISPPPSASLLNTSNIPSNSYPSEVTVESKDEGSSSESSDDMPEGGVEHQGFLDLQKQKTPDEQPLPSNDDLEAIVRGPGSKRQSILHLLDRIIGKQDEEDSDLEEDKAELEEDPDEETGRLRRLPCSRIAYSSDAESEEEESRSPSPSRSAEGTSNSLETCAQGSEKPVKESEHQRGDVVMKVDPPALDGQDDHSSEETHVGSEDHMVIDGPTGEMEDKATAIVAEDALSSPVPGASVPQPSDTRSDEPQEAAETEAEPALDRDGGVPAASEVLEEVAVDPIEPADDLAPPNVSRSSNADPIESPSEDIGSLFPSVPLSTPKPGVSKRIKTRNGKIPDDEADCPMRLEELALEATDEMTPIPPKGKSRRKVTETPASQEPATTRKSSRLSSLQPSTSTPAVVVLLNHRSKPGARAGKAAKTPAKKTEERSDASKSGAKDDAVPNGARIAAIPSLVEWETLAEPSSPSVQLLDELMSSSPHPDDTPVCGRPNDKEKKGRVRKGASSSRAENSQGKERLFDLSSSQTPFPYSQNQNHSAAMAAVPNGKESEETTDSEDEPKVAKKKTKTPIRYRPLSQLASQASLFSPSLPTPANKPVTNGKAKKRPDEEDSSSSSSVADEANGSEHIPRGRRAGSRLETKKKGLLSGI